MIWRYAYTPHIWPMLASGVFMLLLGVYAVRRRAVPGALALGVVMLIAALWSVAATLEMAAADLPTKIFWDGFVAALLRMPMAIARFVFVLAFAGFTYLLTRRNLVLLSIPALVVFALMITNPYHQWMVRGYEYDGVLYARVGAAGWLTTGLAYLLLLVVFAILIGTLIRSPSRRVPVALILTAMLFAHTVYLLDAFRINPFAPLDFVVISMNIAFVLYALALFRFHLLDPIPASRQQVIEQMSEGMLVVDTQDRIVDLNPVMAEMLGVQKERIQGQELVKVLPVIASLDAGQSQSEIALGTGDSSRRYQLSISPLYDRRRMLLGRLVLLHDVTAQQRAQAQLLEQQRSLAALQERDRLARELHDNAGQVLGYVSMQAQAIRKWVLDGDTDQASVQLARLASVAQEAHIDLRASILSLKVGLPQEWSFLPALRQHLVTFQESYAVRTELLIPPELESADYQPATGVQLLRVIQEAITNARRHGNARSVRISFERRENLLRILIADDGCGFVLHELGQEDGKHLGLSFMHERMQQIGGSLAIHSQPGAGAQLELLAPSQMFRRLRYEGSIHDDHRLLLEGLANLLSAHNIQVAGMAYDGLQAIALARSLQPDVILMDIRMPLCDGLCATRQIKAENPGVKIVILTTSSDEQDLFEAVKCGACGYLLKSMDAAELIDCLEQVQQGIPPFSPGLANKILAEFSRLGTQPAPTAEEPPPPPAAGLTPRQLEVLSLISQGYTYKEAGQKLGLSPRTIKYHMAEIMQQLHLEHRSQVLAEAGRLGLDAKPASE